MVVNFMLLYPPYWERNSENARQERDLHVGKHTLEKVMSSEERFACQGNACTYVGEGKCQERDSHECTSENMMALEESLGR